MPGNTLPPLRVSVLYREPKLLKGRAGGDGHHRRAVSVLYREPKLLKALPAQWRYEYRDEFQCSTVSRNC